MIYDIKGQKESKASVQRIMAVLKDVLPRYRGHIGRVTDSTIEFTTPLLQLNSNTFANVSRGVITIRAEEGHSVLSYRLSLFRIRVMATLCTAGMAVPLSSSGIAGLAIVLPMLLFVCWGGFYGISYLITMAKVSSFFGKILRALPAEPPPVPGHDTASVQPPPGAYANKADDLTGNSEIPRVLILAFVSLVLITVMGVLAHEWWLARTYSGPDLVSALRSGVLSEDQVASIHILKFEMPGSWPFSESDYDRKARKKLGADEAGRLLRILSEESVPRQRHNHPQTVYMGILRVDLENGDHHYVIYSLMFCEGEYYVVVASNVANCANPNRAAKLENVFSLRSFLQSHDPWYHTADEPFEARQNSPDTRP